MKSFIKGEKKVSTHTIVSEKCGSKGFPYNTTVRVESVSGEMKPTARRNVSSFKERRIVWKGLVTGQFTRNFDPGKYVWKAHKHDPSGMDGFRDSGHFLVGMTEQQWQKVSHMSPRNQKPQLTTDGLVWKCMFSGCDRMTTSKISAVLHEAEDHFGEDLLRSKDIQATKMILDEKIKEAIPQTNPAEKIRGR